MTLKDWTKGRIAGLPRLACAALLAAVPVSLAAGDAEDRWGPARDDLDRFFGIYGTPGDENGRNYFVAASTSRQFEIPKGRLMIGATWGDVAPWRMHSLGDARFKRPGYNEYNPDMIVRFEVGPDGRARAMVFEEIKHEERERLERLGDLPETWQ